MFQIAYDPNVTNWVTIDQIRKIIQQSKVKGVPEVRIRGNIRPPQQQALLKLLEEHPRTIIITGRRLLPAIESRSSSITNEIKEFPINSELLGMSMIDVRAAEDVSKLRPS